MGLAALCPGTFDPVTNGHLDIIQRAARCFDRVVVAVLENPSKAPLFSVEERLGMLRQAVAPLTGATIEVDSFSGLLVNYAADRGIRSIVKGLRAVSDFDYELQMAQMNHHIGDVETFFVPTSPQWSYLSSSLIRDVVRFGGDVSGMVPGFVREALEARLGPASARNA
jgi:pantetheine-phosphate adenylyltransferase